jgi:hypothetical protein
MFESCTRRQRMSTAKLAAVVALSGAIFAAEAALFAGMVARPLADAVSGTSAMRHREPTRDDLPDFGEAIVVTAPYRTRRASVEARLSPWRNPDPVSFAVNGYCVVER